MYSEYFFFSNKNFFFSWVYFFLKFLSNRCKEVVKVFSYFLLVRWDTHICMSRFSYVCLPIHLSLTIFQESHIWSFWVKNSAKWKMTVTFVMCHIWGTVKHMIMIFVYLWKMMISLGIFSFYLNFDFFLLLMG